MGRGCLLFIIALCFTMVECKREGRGMPATASWWVTTGDRQSLLERQEDLIFTNHLDSLPIIKIDTTQAFQTMDGFGFTLTGGSAQQIMKLKQEARTQLLQELFSREGAGIGISYLRISIGSSDLNDHAFTYDDVPAGSQDMTLAHFQLTPDDRDVVPVLQEIIKINKRIKILGSPWSAPAWMKTNQSLKGGHLKEVYYEVYARYFTTYLKTMMKLGINLDAITIQNEPENPNNNPSMEMTADEQALFIRKYLGPYLKEAGLPTKILLFDHNCDHPEYPIRVLADTLAAQYVDGSAFHLYLGEIGALSKVHDQFPTKNLYFTEQWTSAKGSFAEDLKWHVKNLMIGAPKNWSKNVLEWNLAADPEQKPFTPEGGCDRCLGALTIGDSIVRNVSYFIIGHASKFVPAGSVRVASGEVMGLPSVAYVTPEKMKVLIVVNDGATKREFNVGYPANHVKASLLPGGVATFTFR